MAAAAKLVEKLAEPVAPDVTKPVRMRWWKIDGTIGVHTNQVLKIDGDVKTWMQSEGVVQEITWHPNGGVLVKFFHASLGKTHYLVLHGGHGEAL